MTDWDALVSGEIGSNLLGVKNIISNFNFETLM